MSKNLKITSLNPNEFSIRDIRDLMQFTGESDLEKVFAPLQEGVNNPEGLNTVAYLIYLAERKLSSEFTFEDALDLPLAVIQNLTPDAEGNDGESEQTGNSSS